MLPVEDRSALNHAQRRAHLHDMAAEPLDILVIGGGITGAGVALDASTRGLRVGLLEQRDYSSGTSSRSSKMFHGGLRYLEQFKFSLVREALAERNLMLNLICPHLVRPAPFIYPIRRGVGERLYVGAGILLYEILARLADNPLPWHRHLGQKGLAELAPDLEARGGIQYWDSVVDDARHTVSVARTAASGGALLANSVRVVGFDSQDGRIRRVRAVDLESGDELQMAASAVVNATGVWTDDIEALAGETGIDVEASKGIHLLIPRDRIDSRTGIILRTRVSVLFVIPWDAHWIVGTTDTPWSLGRAHPAASRSDIEYLLRWANTALSGELTTDDVIGVYAGLRPLLKGESEETSRLSREHAVIDRDNGLVSVAGGKYTTYRVMARDAVDTASRYLERPVPRSTTHTVPLVGAQPPDDDRLASRYGSLSSDVRALLAARPDLASKVVSDADYTRAEIAYAVTHEGALHLDDVLTRRTRISIETRSRGVEAALPAAHIMSEALGWSQSTVDREVEHYLARVRAELDSQTKPDDSTADAARMGAPDVRTGMSE